MSSWINALNEALFVIGPEGRISDVNLPAIRLSEQAREKLINSCFSTCFSDPQRVQAAMQQTLTQGRIDCLELTLRTPQNRPIAVRLNAGVVSDSTGQILGILATVHALSQPQEMRQLADERYCFRSFINASLDALMAIDLQGVITDANQQAEHLTGCSRAELLGSRFSAYFTDPLRAMEGLQLALREGQLASFDLKARAKSGTETLVAWHATTFHDEAGILQGVFAAARDATERTRAESHFRSLLESAPEAMVIVNAAGRIARVNSQTEHLFGYDRSELINQPAESLVPQCHQVSVAKPASKSSLNSRAEALGGSHELLGIRKDGTEFPVEISLSPLETEEGILVIRDITERKQVEQSFHEKNLELENASRAKDRFLASMSHELRTPLNAIIGFTGTLLMKLPGPLNAVQQDHLETVERSATHLLSLINDLLDLAKIESGKVELNLVTISCQSVIADVIHALQPMADQKDLTLSSQCPAETIQLQTDLRALTQILLNLTANALKFTEQGAVQIRLAQRLTPSVAITEISIVDTGIGIRADDQRSLFQAFQQIREQGKADQEGTGLGLQVSQKLAHLLGGQISFSSEAGQGSTFLLSIKEPRPCEPKSC